MDATAISKEALRRLEDTVNTTDISDNEKSRVSALCDGNCEVAKGLRKQVEELLQENKELRRQLELTTDKVPGYPEFYNIVYEGDKAVYVYKLLQDYQTGDLKILVM